MDIVFLRVCNYELKSILGNRLKDNIEKLIRLHKKGSIHCCGEGGEFETFVLDCNIFKH
jgi:diphthamide synthase (EF-2-diphthine--ammonia ligase)